MHKWRRRSCCHKNVDRQFSTFLRIMSRKPPNKGGIRPSVGVVCGEWTRRVFVIGNFWTFCCSEFPILPRQPTPDLGTSSEWLPRSEPLRPTPLLFQLHPEGTCCRSAARARRGPRDPDDPSDTHWSSRTQKLGLAQQCWVHNNK